MSDPVTDLYQERILHHYRNPHHCAELSDSECTAEGFNPTCGDRVRLQLSLEGGGLKIQHQTTGCAVCMASVSIMSDQLQDQSVDRATALIEQVLTYLQKDKAELPKEFSETDLPALSSVKPFPMRLKCATLPWTLLKDALNRLTEDPPTPEATDGQAGSPYP